MFIVWKKFDSLRSKRFFYHITRSIKQQGMPGLAPVALLVFSGRIITYEIVNLIYQEMTAFMKNHFKTQSSLVGPIESADNDMVDTLRITIGPGPGSIHAEVDANFFIGHGIVINFFEPCDDIFF